MGAGGCTGWGRGAAGQAPWGQTHARGGILLRRAAVDEGARWGPGWQTRGSVTPAAACESTGTLEPRAAQPGVSRA